MKEFNDVCEFLFSGNNIVLFFEELHNYATRWDCPQGLMRLVTAGRKKGIGLFETSQRPALLNNTIKTQCENYIIFNCHANDAISFRDVIGKVWEEIPKLPQYHYLFYTIREQKCFIFDGNNRKVKEL